MNKTPEFQGASTCPGCGKRFACGMRAGAEKCWCAELPHIGPPDPERKGCYCPACLRALIAERRRPA